MPRRMTAVAIALGALAPLALAALPSQAAPTFPSVPSGGVEFTASIASDPQRDEAEPEVHVDPAGNVYTCGPSGFSNVADFAQVSTDGGDQFHLLGTPPRGQISTGEGGGDCGLASAPVKNAQGNYTWAYTGLGPLLNFSTATTDDVGRTLTGSAISESIPGVDRQWLVATGEKTFFLNYNELAEGFVVQKSTDGGLTYGPRQVVGEGGRIGPLRAILAPDKDESKAVVYFPYDDGTQILLSVSLDGGDTWGACSVIDAEAPPIGGFVTADHDSAGNIFIVWAEKTEDADTYVAAVPRARLEECTDDADLAIPRKTRVNRDKVETTVMPWIVASGLPGRVAVAFYGSETVGNPNSNTFKGAWHVYSNITLNGLAADPDWSQTKATTHPNHYGAICLNGLACDLSVPKADRSFADYFAIDLNPVDGRLNIVYNNSSKTPLDEIGHVASPMVVTQNAGPSLLGGTLTPKRPTLRNVSVDPEEDALAPYSNLFVTLPRANRVAMDFTKVEVGPEIDLTTGDKVPDGGFTVTMTLAGLSNAELQEALSGTGSQSIMWLFRFLNGYQPVGVSAAWSPAAGFTYGYDGYKTASTQAGQADPTAEKIIVWPQATELAGTVNQDSGIIQISVPRSLLKELTGPTTNGKVPALADAKDGSRFYDAAAYSLGNTVSPVQALQSFLYPVDNAPAMDFLLGGGVAPPLVKPSPRPSPGVQPTASASPTTRPRAGGPGGPGLPSTGGLGYPLLALGLVALATVVVRRKRGARAGL